MDTEVLPSTCSPLTPPVSLFPHCLFLLHAFLPFVTPPSLPPRRPFRFSYVGTRVGPWTSSDTLPAGGSLSSCSGPFGEPTESSWKVFGRDRVSVAESPELSF